MLGTVWLLCLVVVSIVVVSVMVVVTVVVVDREVEGLVSI